MYKMPSNIVTASIIIAVIIVAWLIFLVLDGIFSLFIFAPYSTPKLENSFQPTVEQTKKTP